MERYENGKIYRLVGTDGSFYIGSTCMPLCKRLWGHKAKAKKFPNQKNYNHFNNLGWDNVKIILVEDFKCETKEALVKREQEEIDKYSNNPLCLNSFNSFGVNTKKRSIVQKKQYEKNKDKVHQRYINNREARLAYLKEYREKNRDVLLQKKREYYATKKISPTNIEDVAERYESRTTGTTQGSP